MNLTHHFTLEELTASTTGARLGINNEPTDEVVAELMKTAEMLERIRAVLNVPITVSSGYRCEELNKAVGGVANSDHIVGKAADILAPAYGSPYKVAAALVSKVSELGIGQLIYEGSGVKRWVHVSTQAPAKPVNRILTISNEGTFIGIKGP